MNEMNANPVDLSTVLREGVEASLEPAPVVLVTPIGNQRLSLLEGDALRPVTNGFPLRPPRGRQPMFQIVQCRLGDMHLERCNVLSRRGEHKQRSILGVLLGPNWRLLRCQQTGTTRYCSGTHEPTAR